MAGVKRKAITQKVRKVKEASRSPSPVPPPIPSIYDDPMIDPVASESDEDEDEEDDDADEAEDQDDEELDEDEDDAEELEQPVAGPSRPSASKNLYRPPTLSDVDLIASSSSFSTSTSTFNLQINALLADATPRGGSLSPVESLVVLWKKWAKKRGLSKERGRDAHLARTVAAWVLQGGEIGGIDGERLKTRRINGMGRGMGGWELLRAGWNFVASTDFDKTPVFVTPPKDKKDRKVARLPGDCLLDATGSVNVFAGWTRGEVELLQYHARETLAVLEDSSVDHFADVFLKSYALTPSTFDEYLHIHIDPLPTTLAPMDALLRRGFGDRIKLLVLQAVEDDIISVGLVFDSAHATRVLDVGPPTEKAEQAAAFRELWGDRAELRRFKDGNIAESVVWDITRPEEASQIPGRIIKHLLERHFKIPSENITTISSNPAWSTIIQVPQSARESVSTAGAEKQGFRPMMDAYNELYKVLKNVDDELPLAILTVQPASELLRFSSVFVPHPTDVNRYPSAPDSLKHVPTADIVLQFESSPRWPDDLAAIQKVKLAMFEKLARVVVTHQKGAKANIALEQGRSEIEDQASLEIFTGGVGFRIRIFHERERILLERIINGETQTFGTALPQPPLRLAIPALELHIRRFIWSTRHHAGITPMHHRYPSYSTATRLLKRWIAAHMLSLLISSEVIELIMAKVYLDPGSLSTSSSAVTGFIRAMDLLANWDWRVEALIVPLYSINSTDGVKRIRFPEDARAEATRIFDVRRKKLEASGNAAKAGWRVVTEEDLEGSRYCAEITVVIAGRVKALARGTLENVKALEDLDVMALFATPTQDYDVLIHLNPALATRYAQAVNPDTSVWEGKTKYRNLQGDGLFGRDVKLGLDLVGAFARDIQRLYAESLLVFYDENGGTKIGLLWNPQKTVARSMKPFLGYSVKPAVSEAALVQIDKEGIVGDIARMGRGLIERVEVK